MCNPNSSSPRPRSRPRRSDLTSARAAFLPQIDFSSIEERYVPSNAQPVVVVDNTVLGGAQTKTAYGSLSLQWNLWNNGQDVAAYHGAQAGIRAATYGVDEQVDKTLIDVLQAYADLYAAEVTARNDGTPPQGWKVFRRARKSAMSAVTGRRSPSGKPGLQRSMPRRRSMSPAGIFRQVGRARRIRGT